MVLRTVPVEMTVWGTGRFASAQPLRSWLDGGRLESVAPEQEPGLGQHLGPFAFGRPHRLDVGEIDVAVAAGAVSSAFPIDAYSIESSHDRNVVSRNSQATRF